MKFLIFFSAILVTSRASELKNVLSFGGNGNIGSAVLDRLINSKEEYSITLVSRGKWHFDSGIRIKPFVDTFVCDRGFEPTCDNCSINALRHCPELMKRLEQTPKFDLVLDFSSYRPKWVHDAIDVLKDKQVGLYIYISTDSVYEVSVPKATKRRSTEKDAVRPQDLSLRQKLNKEDPYGDAKFAGEEALADQQSAGGFPWLTFRYSDVIGPRDTTRRFPLYQTWIKFYQDIGIPFFLPGSAARVGQSLTYVEDAAEAVMLALERGNTAWNTAYNIAMVEEITLTSVIQDMAKIQNATVDKTNDDDGNFHLYPTVFSGPLDISKAEKMLGFKPTSLDAALRSTINWYETEFVQSYDYREDILSELMAHVVPRKLKDQVYLAVDRELAKSGVVNRNYRSKRKGELDDLDDIKLAKIKQEL